MQKGRFADDEVPGTKKAIRKRGAMYRLVNEKWFKYEGDVAGIAYWNIGGRENWKTSRRVRPRDVVNDFCGQKYSTGAPESPVFITANNGDCEYGLFTPKFIEGF